MHVVHTVSTEKPLTAKQSVVMLTQAMLVTLLVTEESTLKTPLATMPS